MMMSFGYSTGRGRSKRADRLSVDRRISTVPSNVDVGL
jgi:hypothetical protein